MCESRCFPAAMHNFVVDTKQVMQAGEKHRIALATMKCIRRTNLVGPESQLCPHLEHWHAAVLLQLPANTSNCLLRLPVSLHWR
jgi:hypothetical protein